MSPRTLSSRRLQIFLTTRSNVQELLGGQAGPRRGENEVCANVRVLTTAAFDRNRTFLSALLADLCCEPLLILLQCLWTRLALRCFYKQCGVGSHVNIARRLGSSQKDYFAPRMCLSYTALNIKKATSFKIAIVMLGLLLAARRFVAPLWRKYSYRDDRRSRDSETAPCLCTPTRSPKAALLFQTLHF